MKWPEGVGEPTKPYDRFVPTWERSKESRPTPRAKPGSYRGWHQDLRITGPAPALPWSKTGLAEYKMAAIKEVMDRLSTGAELDMHQRGATSEPVWTASEERRSQMLKDIIVWQPKEPVLPDHRAEAVRIVYEGLLTAGCVPWGARRQPRSRMRIA